MKSSQNSTSNTTTLELTPEQIALFKKAGRPILRVLMIPVLLFSLPFTLIGGYFTFAGIIGGAERTVAAEATVTKISSSYDSEMGATCTYSYRFTVKDKVYSGTNLIGSSDNCAKEEGDTVSVKYDPTHPSNNGTEESFLWIFGLAFFIPGVVMLLVSLIGLGLLRNRDNSPATQPQLELIENGFRELGEFWTPHSMTQREAREILLDINHRIALQKQR